MLTELRLEQSRQLVDAQQALTSTTTVTISLTSLG